MAVQPGEIFLSLWAEQFGAIFGRERLGFGYESGLGGLVGLGGWCGPTGDADADLGEKFFLAGRGADAKQAGWLAGGVGE
jgi:hypothetical protein